MDYYYALWQAYISLKHLREYKKKVLTENVCLNLNYYPRHCSLSFSAGKVAYIETLCSIKVLDKKNSTYNVLLSVKETDKNTNQHDQHSH